MIRDNFDTKILKILQKDARLSYAQISREIGLSPSAVAERIQRLEDEEVIIRYMGIINAKKIGYSLSAYITLSFEEKGFKPFFNAVFKFPEIVDCSRVTGKDCLIMKVLLKNNVHLEEFIDRIVPYGNPTTSVILSDIISNGEITINRNS